jgi:hypothetical protein
MIERMIADFWRGYACVGPRLEELQRDMEAAEMPEERAGAERLMDTILAR